MGGLLWGVSGFVAGYIAGINKVLEAVESSKLGKTAELDELIEMRKAAMDTIEKVSNAVTVKPAKPSAVPAEEASTETKLGG
jgi:hypothetical protein